jgi:hypothetical protein
MICHLQLVEEGAGILRVVADVLHSLAISRIQPGENLPDLHNLSTDVVL